MAITDATVTPHTTRRYFPQLEGIRGLAALGVLVTHVAFSSRQIRWTEVPGFEQRGHGVYAYFLQQIEVCLPIFFALSGMLLYRPYARATIAGTRGPKLKPYLWRRALRTLPAYWVLVIVTLFTLNPGNVHSVWRLVRPFLLLQIYDANAWPTSQGLEQTWSLGTEIAFYATLPIFAALLNRYARRVDDPVRRARRILWCLGGAILVGFAFTVYDHRPSMGIWPVQNDWPIGWIGFIAVGMGIATLAAASEVTTRTVFPPFRWMARKPGLSWVAALVVLVLCMVSPFGDPAAANYPPMSEAIVEHWLYLLFGLFIVAPLALPEGSSRFITGTLTNRVVLFLGRISYGVYLWHIAIIYWWNGSMFGAPSFLELLFVTLAGSIVLATLSYLVVEHPAMKLRERLGKASVTPSVETVDEPVPVAEPAQSVPAAKAPDPVLG